MERLTESYTQWICSDCYSHLDDVHEYEKPYVILLPKDDEAPDFCPRCAAYGSFSEGAEDLVITNTPQERYERRQREKREKRSQT